jgi:hypothetical protein
MIDDYELRIEDLGAVGRQSARWRRQYTVLQSAITNPIRNHQSAIINAIITSAL